MKEAVDNLEGMPISPVVTAGGVLFIGATVHDKKFGHSINRQANSPGRRPFHSLPAPRRQLMKLMDGNTSLSEPEASAIQPLRQAGVFMSLTRYQTEIRWVAFGTGLRCNHQRGYTPTPQWLVARRSTRPGLTRLWDASEPRVPFEQKLAGVQSFGLEGRAIGRDESPVADFAPEQANETD